MLLLLIRTRARYVVYTCARGNSDPSYRNWNNNNNKRSVTYETNERRRPAGAGCGGLAMPGRPPQPPRTSCVDRWRRRRRRLYEHTTHACMHMHDACCAGDVEIESQRETYIYNCGVLLPAGAGAGAGSSQKDTCI